MNRMKFSIFVLILAIGVAALQAGCAPAPPTGFGAEVQLGKVILTWDDNSDNEDGFRVYRRPYGTSEFTNIATLAPNTISYEDNAGLEKDYEYKVGTFNNNGESSSPIIRVKTAPKTPTNLKFTNPTEGEIVLTWTDNATVEDGYEIWQRAVGGESWMLLTNALPPNSYTFTYAGSDLYCANNYEYKLAAYVRNGDKVIYSEWIYITGNPCENWTFSTVEEFGEGFGILHASIAASGAPHISYYTYYCPDPNPDICGSFDYRYLKYATGSPGAWQIEILRYMKEGLFNSIAAGSGEVHISFFGFGGKVWYVRKTSGVWKSTVIDDSYTGEMFTVGNPHTSIALGSGGNIHVNYLIDDFIIRYAKLSQNPHPKPGQQPYLREYYAVDTGNAPSLAVSEDVPYITYVKGNVMCAVKNGDSWQISEVDKGYRPSIAAKGGAHIVYGYTADMKFKYATGIPGGWQIHTIDSLNTGNDNWAIAAESSNIVHIFYEGPGGLKYATNKTGAWRIVNLDSVAIPEYSLDIALDGRVHVVYVSGSKLKYARGVSKNRPK